MPGVAVAPVVRHSSLGGSDRRSESSDWTSTASGPRCCWARGPKESDAAEQLSTARQCVWVQLKGRPRDEAFATVFAVS